MSRSSLRRRHPPAAVRPLLAWCARRRHTGRVLALALAAVTLALAGCGSSSGNGLSDRSAGEILAAGRSAAAGASSVVIADHSAQGRASLTSALQLSAAAGHAKVALVGLAFEATRIGATLYVKGGADLYRSLLPGAHSTIPPGAWLKAPAEDLSQIAAFTELKPQLERLLSARVAVTKGATTSVDGQPAIELKAVSKLSRGAIFIATTGKPYPLLLVKSGGRETGRTEFSHWDQGISLSAPSPTIIAAR